MRVRLERQPDFWSGAALHLPLAVLSGIALALGRWLPLEHWPVIPCWFLRLTGHPCPFCGGCRSFSHAANGDWWGAAVISPLGTAVFAATIATFVVSLVALGTKRRLVVDLGSTAKRTVLITLAAVVAASWAYRWWVGD